MQPWGTDGDKRKYWLVEGYDDTSFRLYRENHRTQKSTSTAWRSMASNLDELMTIIDLLEKDGSQASRRLAVRIRAVVPRFEATAEVCSITRHGLFLQTWH